MSEKSDKKQDPAIEEIEGKEVSDYTSAEALGGSHFYGKTVVEEVVIEEITVTTRKGKAAKRNPANQPALESTEIVSGAGYSLGEIKDGTERLTEKATDGAAPTKPDVIKPNGIEPDIALENVAPESITDGVEPESIEPDKPSRTDNAEDSLKKAGEKPRKRGGVFNIILIAIIGILAVAIVFLNVYVLCPVQQDSMTPTILDGERVLLLRSKRVKNGDVFVFATGEKDADGNSINLIKRAVASGGDRLLFVVSGDIPPGLDLRVVKLYRDTGSGFAEMDEDYINEPMYMHRMPQTEFAPVYQAEGDTIDQEAAADFILTVPDGHFYALGDNRNESNDSRSFGFVQKKTVVGRMRLKLEKGSIGERILQVLYWDRTGCGILVEAWDNFRESGIRLAKGR